MYSFLYNQVFCIRQVDDVVCPARDHVNCFDLIPAYFKLHHLSSVNISLLDQAMTMHNNELLPLAVMPVLPLCNAWFGDVDADLTAIYCVNQFRKAVSVVKVHLHGILEFFNRQVSQIQTE